MSSNIKPVILCGGSGTRLWPLSRESFPKQFVTLIDGKSLLELTLNRVKQLDSPICITNEEHRFFVRDLIISDLKSDHSLTSILLEPVGRNTAAAMASAAVMPGVSPSDLLLFLPSDHFIPDVDSFVSTIQAGVAAAECGYIVTFGVQPSFPSTAYGYIKQGDTLNFSNTELNTYAVSSFEEKPSLDKALEMILSGEYLWNAGIFLCKASVLIDAFNLHSPDILNSCKMAMQSSQIDGNFIRPEKKHS
jgi:mannose-1-phosphate guanylyltransferase / mannose-6-phosphate isomerase